MQNNRYPAGGYPQNGNPQNGYQQNGYQQNGYPQNGYPQNGNPQGGNQQNAYPRNGYSRNGYPQNGYPQNGYPRNGYPQRPNDPYRHKKRKKGSIFVWIQLVLTLAVLFVLYKINMMPMQYLVITGAVLLLLFVLSFGLCYSYRSRSGGRVLSIIISLLLGVLLGYLFKTYSVLDQITGADTKIDEMTVLVLTEDPAQSLADTAGYVYGMTSTDSKNANEMLEEVRKQTGTEVATASFTSYTEEAYALLNGQIGAIIFNEAYREMIETDFPGFSESTRILSTKTIKTKVEVSKNSKKVAKEPFLVYITGIDTYGEISKTSRSDVNILAAVNPTTHKILLVSTPRDSYVELAPEGTGVNNAYDTLTHAGIYGVQESISTLQNLYGVKIDYYVRVNFSGFETIVDALGGITVDSDYAFLSNDGEWFDEGPNELDGRRALSFARERYAFEDGDFQRGRDQMKVIKAIIDKAMSPAILGNYTQLLDSVADSMETSMTTSEIGDLVQMQLSSGEQWNIENYTVLGHFEDQVCYSYGASPLSVVVLEDEYIAEAVGKIQAVMNGE